MPAPIAHRIASPKPKPIQAATNANPRSAANCLVVI